MTKKSLLRRIDRLVKRLLSNENALVAEPTPEAVAVATQPISSIRSRELAHFAGEIVSVTPSQAGQPPDCHVEVADATGRIRLIWMGRQLIPGIDVGRTIRVSGRVATINQHLVIFNPAYAIEAREED